MSSIKIKDKIGEKGAYKVARFKKDTRRTDAHKHNNYLEIIFLIGGSGTHQIDDQAFEIKPSTLFVIRKDQVHHWNLTSEPIGYVLILRNALLIEGIDKEMSTLFKIVSAINCNYLQETNEIVTLFELMLEIELSNNQLSTSYLNGLLKALLAKIALISKTSQQPQLPQNYVFAQFVELLSNEGELYNNVSFYAKKLHCTPQNLNAICRKELNISASEYLAKHIISEVKRLLIYSNLSVSEIGTIVHFKDNSHFSKFFKKHTTTTPREYRFKLKFNQ